MNAAGVPLGIPDVGPGQYLLNALFDMGPTICGAFGETAVDWPTLTSFAQCTDVPFEAWELRALKDMSARYLEGRRAGADHNSIPPIEWEVTDQ